MESNDDLTTQMPTITPDPYNRQGRSMINFSKKQWWFAAGAVVVAFIVACACCNGIQAQTAATTAHITATSTANISTPTTNPTPTNTPIPTATPRPTPKPTPTIDVQAYASMVAADTNTITTDMSAIGTDCSNTDLNACETDLYLLNDDITSFQNDLNSHPAPPCLKTSDTNLRAALSLFKDGDNQALNSLNNNDPAAMATAIEEFNQGSAKIKEATTAAQNASC